MPEKNGVPARRWDESQRQSMTAAAPRTPQHRLRKNPVGLSFRAAAGDEESRTVLKALRTRFLAPLGMTARKGFCAACTAARDTVCCTMELTGNAGKIRVRTGAKESTAYDRNPVRDR